MKSANCICLIIFAAVLVFTIAAALADEKDREDVDEIIQGFEEDPLKEEKDLEDLMQGFDEDSGEDAEQPQDQDDIRKGFKDGAEETSPGPELEKKPESWKLNGEFAFTTTCNISPDAVSPWRDLTMLRPELELALENRFSDRWRGRISARGFYDVIYGLRGRDEYTDQVLDDYVYALELEDTFIEGRLTDYLDTKIGRQIVVWGVLDNLRVNDVLNPLDLRLPGLTDIEDLRLPVTMVKFDVYFGSWNLSAMALPEVRFSKLPVFGSDFYPAPQPPPAEEMPDDGLGNMPYAASLSGVFSGWDIGFYGADIYSDQTYTSVVDPGPPARSVRKHARIRLLGSAANLARGNWLLKAEMAWFDGLQYTSTPGVQYSRIDAGGGLEYSGFSETTVSLEAVNRHILDYDQRLAEPADEIRENEFQWAFRYMRDFMHDTLTLTLLASTFGIKADDGAFERLDVEYDITDAVSIRGGLVLYQSGDKGLFQDVDANDRLFAVVTYSF